MRCRFQRQYGIEEDRLDTRSRNLANWNADTLADGRLFVIERRNFRTRHNLNRTAVFKADKRMLRLKVLSMLPKVIPRAPPLPRPDAAGDLTIWIARDTFIGLLLVIRAT